MIHRIQNRRGTAAEWTSANPILADGEMGYEKDTKKIKIGDGSTAWNALGYSGPEQLVGENLNVSQITLPRTGGLVKPADTLTLDANGRLVVNDNDRPGGRLVANDRRFRGMHIVPDTSGFIYDKFVTIPLTAAECAVNTTYQLIGSVKARQPTTPTEFGWGLLDAATDAAAAGFPNPVGLYGSTASTAFYEADINITMKNDTGYLGVLDYPDSGFISSKTSSGTGVTFSTVLPSNPGAEFPSVAQNLYLHVTTFGGGVGAFFFEYDLELIVTKP